MTKTSQHRGKKQKSITGQDSDVLILTLNDHFHGIKDLVEICVSYGYYHTNPSWNHLRYKALFVKFWIDIVFQLHDQRIDHWLAFSQSQMEYDDQAKERKWISVGDTFRQYYKAKQFKLCSETIFLIDNPLNSEEKQFMQEYEPKQKVRRIFTSLG